jgi:hypothetical protein
LFLCLTAGVHSRVHSTPQMTANNNEHQAKSNGRDCRL